MPVIKADLTHVGIFVRDLDRMRRFYTEVLGLIESDSGRERRGLSRHTLVRRSAAYRSARLVDDGRGNPQDHRGVVSKGSEIHACRGVAGKDAPGDRERGWDNSMRRTTWQPR